MTEDTALHTARTLPYSAGAIYRAFGSPDCLARWWGPEGFSNTFETFDFTAGGAWKFVMHGPDGKDYHNESRFVELVPDEKIVIRHDCPPYFTLVVELEPDGTGTLLSWTQIFDDAATAEAVRQRFGSANEENIDRLSRVLGGHAGAG